MSTRRAHTRTDPRTGQQIPVREHQVNTRTGSPGEGAAGVADTVNRLAYQSTVSGVSPAKSEDKEWSRYGFLESEVEEWQHAGIADAKLANELASNGISSTEMFGSCAVLQGATVGEALSDGAIDVPFARSLVDNARGRSQHMFQVQSSASAVAAALHDPSAPVSDKDRADLRSDLDSTISFLQELRLSLG